MSSILRSLNKIGKNEYLVAKRQGGLSVLFVFMIISGIYISGSNLICFLCICDNFKDGFNYVYLVIGGTIVFISGIVFLVRYFNTPRYAVIFKDGYFYFGKKLKCSPMNVSVVGGDVTKRMGAENNSNRVVKNGTLFFAVNGGSYKFRFISNVDNVLNAIAAIKREYIACYNDLKKTGQLDVEEQQKQPEQNV